MVATRTTDRAIYKKYAKTEGRIYYEIVLDSCGIDGMNGVKRQSSMGTMTPENARKIQELLLKIQSNQQ